MKITIVLAILVAWEWTRSEAFLSLKQYDETINKLCGGRRTYDNTRELINGQNLPIPNTIESFIGLVEKIELLHPEWRSVEILKMLLLTFRYDDAVVKSNQVLTRGTGDISRYYELLIKLFRVPSKGPELRERDLTQDERCSLYYMISHTVNSTIRPGEDKVREEKGIQYPEYLREQGVLTLSSQTTHAFALGKVLLGLLAGLERIDVDANQIFNEMKPGANTIAETSFRDVSISVLYAATFGDVISVTKKMLEETSFQDIESYFYPNGFWSESVCPTHYLLEVPDYHYRHATYSLIRGAIDGYRLGSHVKEMTGSNAKVRLSQILRMYYSGQGFAANRALSWCSRRELTFSHLQQDAIAFDKFYSALSDKIVGDDVITEEVQKVLSFLDRETTQIYDESTRDGNKCDLRDTAGMQCETPTHVIAILDMKSKDRLDEQSEIVGNLSSGIKMGEYLASSVSVYTNLRPYGNADQLDIALNHTTVSGCGGCAVKHFDPQRANSESELEVFRDLNITLGEVRSELETEPGVPSKVVLYFNYGNPTWESNLQRALNEIRWRHKSVKLLVVGSRKESLRLFAEEKDIETSITPMKIESLKEKVCKVPALFQYYNCHRRSEGRESDQKFEGVITPRHVQYWMMEPKYFLKSFSIKLIFQATNGEIRVCFSRDYSKIFDSKDPVGAECKRSTAGEEVTFYVWNPCHRYTESTCDPFYFFIEGKTAPLDDKPCQEPVCRTLDQISFEFRHEGISCNSANSQFTTFSLVLFLAVTVWKFVPIL